MKTRISKKSFYLLQLRSSDGLDVLLPSLQSSSWSHNQSFVIHFPLEHWKSLDVQVFLAVGLAKKDKLLDIYIILIIIIIIVIITTMTLFRCQVLFNWRKI